MGWGMALEAWMRDSIVVARGKGAGVVWWGLGEVVETVRQVGVLAM